MYINFKQFVIEVTDSEEEEFINKLDSLCKKYAVELTDTQKNYLFRFDTTD